MSGNGEYCGHKQETHDQTPSQTLVDSLKEIHPDKRIDLKRFVVVAFQLVGNMAHEVERILWRSLEQRNAGDANERCEKRRRDGRVSKDQTETSRVGVQGW